MTFILQHLDTIIIAIVAIVLGYDRLRAGTSSLRKEITADYKERNDQLDAKIKELEEKHNETLRELSALRATMIEKDKHIDSLTLLNQGKNPEIIDLLHKITDSNNSIIEFMKVMHKVLIDSKTELHYQSDMLKKGDERNQGIDKASSSGHGDAMLTPEKNDTI